MELKKIPLVPAYHLFEYQREHSGLAKKWNVIHAATALVQLLAAFGLAELQPLPSALQGTIKPWIRTPSSKQWLICALAVLRHLERTEGETSLWKDVGRFLDDAAELFDDRNDFAHLVSLTSSLAERIFETQREDIDRILERLAWLEELSLVARADAGPVDLRGSDPGAEAPFRPTSPAVAQALERHFTEHPDAVVAVHGERVLSLWPFFVYGGLSPAGAGAGHAAEPSADPAVDPAAGPAAGHVFHVYTGYDLASRGCIYAPIDPRQVKCVGTDQMTRALQVIFALDQRVLGFEEEIYRDAREFVGRAHELDLTEGLVRAGAQRLLWLWGRPGSGKSFLASAVAARLLDHPPAGALVLFFRFREGDHRNNRGDFHTYLLERLEHWEGLVPAAAPAERGGPAAERIAGLLRRIAPDRRVVVVLDGLDEITSRDPGFAEEALLPLAFERTTWLLVGRHDAALERLFAEGAGAVVFPAGLPLMADDDIRFMMFRSLVRQGERLLALDSVSEEPLFTAPPAGPSPVAKRELAPALRQAFEANRAALSAAARAFPLGDQAWLLLDAGLGQAFALRSGADGWRVARIQVRNVFIDRVARCAEGLPLYVKYLLSEISAAGAGYAYDPEHLPQGLGDYYKKVLAAVLAPSENVMLRGWFLGVLAITKEPLTVDQLAELLCLGGVVSDPDDREELVAVLAQASQLLKAEATPERLPGQALYHHSLREHLLVALAKDIKMVRRQLGGAWLDLDGAPAPLRPYLVRHGVPHLLEEGRLADAVTLLHRLREEPDGLPSDAVNRYAKAACDALGALFAAERDAPPPAGKAAAGPLAREGQRIDPEELLDLVIGFYEIDPLFSAVRLVYRAHRARWPALLDRLLAEDDMIVRYTVAQVMAQAFLETGDEATMTAIRGLAAAEGLDEREVGAYALKFVYMKRPALVDPAFLAGLAGGRSTYDRTIAAEILVHLALGGARLHDLVPASVTSFWQPLWDNNKVEIEDVLAAESFRAGRVPEDPAVRAAHDLLAATEEARRRLAEAVPAERWPRTAELISGFYLLGREMVRPAEGELRRSPHLAEVMALLCSHPAWDVREAAATTLASIAATREEAVALIRRFMRHPSAKVRYGAVEAAWSFRTMDGHLLFEEALALLKADPNCRVRGLLAENMANWIIKAPAAEKAALLASLGDLVAHFLSDDDTWPLENVYLLLNHLHEEGLDAAALAGRARSPLLPPGEPWWTLDREGFIAAIEARKVAQAGAAEPVA